MMTEKYPQIGWAFGLQWVLANSLGWIIGMAIFSVLGSTLEFVNNVFFETIGWAIFSGLVGAIIGVNQWIVLNLFEIPRGGRWTRWWVVATIAGWMLSLLLVVGLELGTQLGFTISGAVIGITVGIPQWFVLRTVVRRAEWWGIANALGWLAGMASIDLINQAIGFALTGLISGIITGAGMVWLLRSPRTVPEKPGQAPEKPADETE